MHHVIMQATDGPDLGAILQSMGALGVTRVIFPPSEYRPKAPANARKSQYDTARLLPRGSDEGFADRFLSSRRRRRDT